MDGECPPIYPCLTPAGSQSSSPKDVGLLHWLSLPQPLLPRVPGTNSLALDFPTSTFTCVLSPLPQTLQEGCTKIQTNPHHSRLKPAVIPATAFKKSSPGPAPAASRYSEGYHFDGSLRLLGDASAVCPLMLRWERQRGGLQKHPQHTHLEHTGFYLFH